LDPVVEIRKALGMSGSLLWQYCCSSTNHFRASGAFLAQWSFVDVDDLHSASLIRLVMATA
jgi:hypothetical protein